MGRRQGRANSENSIVLRMITRCKLSRAKGRSLFAGAAQRALT
jgi:hypothetical protein